MPEHNGDYSPEMEHKRKLKREKVQRSRIRKRIAEGRATDSELAAMQAWEEGYEWDLTGESAQQAAFVEPEQETTSIPWVGWIAGGLLAAFFGSMIYRAIRGDY